MTVRLTPFDDAYATRIVGWARLPVDRDAWASLGIASPDVFQRWHAEPGVHPFVLLDDGTPTGYGEVWEDPEEDEAEIARVIVDPGVRGRGVGKRLVSLLAQRARDLGCADVWVRVVPTNAVAIACYRGAGFVRIERAEEVAFNEGQPRPYVWMRLEPRPEVARTRPVGWPSM